MQKANKNGTNQLKKNTSKWSRCICEVECQTQKSQPRKRSSVQCRQRKRILMVPSEHGSMPIVSCKYSVLDNSYHIFSSFKMPPLALCLPWQLNTSGALSWLMWKKHACAENQGWSTNLHEIPRSIQEILTKRSHASTAETIYGLRQAARAFWRELMTEIAHMQFKQSPAGSCLYYCWTTVGLIIWLTWIDKCLIADNSAGVEAAKEQSNWRLIWIIQPKTLGVSCIEQWNP